METSLSPHPSTFFTYHCSGTFLFVLLADWTWFVILPFQPLRAVQMLFGGKPMSRYCRLHPGNLVNTFRRRLSVGCPCYKRNPLLLASVFQTAFFCVWNTGTLWINCLALEKNLLVFPVPLRWIWTAHMPFIEEDLGLPLIMCLAAS